MMKIVTLLSVVVLMSACAAYTAGPTAKAQLQPTMGNAVAGQVTFTQQGNHVLVAGEVTGLAPNKVHGFHIHEKGDCSSGDGVSTGGHFNPTGKPHGAHDNAEHHAGDLQSLQADANGVARFSYTSTAISVGAGATDVVGRGLIVHRDADDFKTQPTGNSGARVACGVLAKGY